MAESKIMFEFLQMVKDSSAWDKTEMREILTKEMDRIFGASKEKDPELPKSTLSFDHLDRDGESAHS